ncbi:MAG: 3-isopropylmalate dehydratase small subunit [Planctomycetota bacterium]
MIEGKAWKFANNVNTDEIIPARYLNTTDPKELARHVMEDADPSFAAKVKAGDLIAAGKNFGCGSSREHAPLAIRSAGIVAVVAASFARIFFRNAINTGLPIVESPDAASDARGGDVLRIDLERGELLNVTQSKRYDIAPLPVEMRRIIAAGGLMEYAKSLLGKTCH